jgi:hypothetical protein
MFLFLLFFVVGDAFVDVVSKRQYGKEIEMVLSYSIEKKYEKKEEEEYIIHSLNKRKRRFDFLNRHQAPSR